MKNITLPEGKTNYTISFGSERNLYQAADNTFVPEEFLVYVSNDGSKWVKLEYAFPNGLKNRRWDLASSTFTVPSGTKSLHIYIKATLASAYLMDDLDLSVAASAGTAIDFSKGIDLGTGGSTGGGETPAPTGNNIAAVCAAAAGSAADLKDVLVTGVTTQSYVITDETGSVLVFVKADPKVKVGDKVNVAGTTGEHNGLIQITAPTTTVVSSNNTVTYPAPLEFTEANLADTPKKVTYVSFTGNVKKNNQYYNIYIGSVTDKDLSLSYYTGNMDEFVDCDIKVKGWYVGGGTHYQIVATEVEKVETTGPKFSVSTTALTAKAGDTSASFDVKGNVKWTVASDNAAYTVSPASGDGAGTVTVKFAANETENDVTVNLTVSTTEEVATKSYTVVLTHKGKSAAGEVEVSAEKAYLAANQNGKMDDVISYTNDSDYGTNAVTELRVYKGKNLKITAVEGYTITKVEFTCTKNCGVKQGFYVDSPVVVDSGATSKSTGAGKIGTITITGTTSSVKYTAESNQMRVEKMTVTYKKL